MSDLLNEFKAESASLIEQMLDLLTDCEAGTLLPNEAQKFGLYADRIMGTVKQLSISQGGGSEALGAIAKFTELCKILGYKCTQLPPNDGLWPVAVAVLLDSTEELKQLIENFEAEREAGAISVTKTLLDRLQWLNEQFADNIQGGVPMSQVQILINTLKPS